MSYDIEKFYSENDIEDWKIVLGEDLHYHLGSKSDGDIFEQSIRNLYNYIPQGSKILDCGCGWGGPANLLIEERKCEITGVTISRSQAGYITKFPVILEDLLKFVPTEKYDVALFVESLTHIQNPAIVLKNIHDYVDKIVIKDYTWEHRFYNPVWGMQFYPKNEFIQILENSGYTVDSCEEDDQVDIFKTCSLWYENIQKLDPIKITGHLRALELLSISVLNHLGPKYKDGEGAPMLITCATPV